MPASRSIAMSVNDRLRRMFAAGAGKLLGDERLHAEADAVDPGANAKRSAFSGVMDPGAASMVASFQGLPGTSPKEAGLASPASIWLGVPPPR